MKLHKPVYADINIKSLIDYGWHLFIGLWDGFPTYTSIERDIANLYTYDQINAVVESGILDNEFVPGELKTAIMDYIKE